MINIYRENSFIIIEFIKLFMKGIGMLYMLQKSSQLSNQKHEKKIYIIGNTIISTCCVYIKLKINDYIYMLFFTILWIILFEIISKNKIVHSISMIIIVSSINYALFLVAGTIISIIYTLIYTICNYAIIGQESTIDDYIGILFILVTYVILVYRMMKIKRLQRGLDFIKNTKNNESFDILILNISIIILAFLIIFLSSETEINMTIDIGISLFTFIISFIFTIFKSIEACYKEILKDKEIENLTNELEKYKMENLQLQQDNLEISKRIHSIKHEQDILKYKIESFEEESENKIKLSELKKMMNETSDEIYVDVKGTKLNKTGIDEIDNVLGYFQSICIKENIKFDTQINGNIHYMINNLINTANLKILLMDHLKDAIIAIKHSENINRSILFKIGNFDGIYSLYIYDSGIEFDKNVLENLGKKAITTHADEGGTGCGFLNTIDTLKKCKASLIIKQIGAPCKDNFTKIIIIKFDGKSEFLIR